MGKIPGVPKRYILVGLCFFGLFQMYAIRTCLSVAIVAMVSNRTVLQDGKLVHKSRPLWSDIVFKLFLALRIIEGLVLGLIAAAHHCIWASWSHIYERSSLLTIAGSGTIVGTILTMPTTGLLSESEGGWPLAFYFFGSIGIIWFVVWQMFMYEIPSDHPYISREEIDYIGKPWDKNNTKVSIPWKAIVTSPSVWACNFTMFVGDWSFYTMLICIPLFMKQILKCSITEAGFVSAVPYVLLAIISPIASLLADRLISRKILSIEFTRKLFQALGLIISSCFIVIVGYETRPGYSLVFLTLGIGTYGIGSPGVSPNLIDMSPKYAGLLMGIANTAGSMSGFLSPAVVGIITTQGTLEEWRLVFWLTAIMSLSGTAVYIAFSSTDKQSWADD
ncbi:hypothetical protein QZH41_016775 [Actinostola sp. cb2023]|nr:hypothetical protein QZH41_016775 [Actinostola sp. cb2023]